jgi:DNA-binding transcriptional regulator YiaG
LQPSRAFVVFSRARRATCFVVEADDIKALRKELRCTPQELADALGVTAKVVMAWEQEEMFPTKQYVDKMNALRGLGEGAVPKKRRGRKVAQTPMQVLADPELWRLVRKLLAHDELREQAQKLAQAYPDPE